MAATDINIRYAWADASLHHLQHNRHCHIPEMMEHWNTELLAQAVMNLTVIGVERNGTLSP